MRIKQRQIKSWMKHLDFIALDLLCLQAAFLLAHALLLSGGNLYEIPYATPYYRYLILMLTIGQCLTICLSDCYTDIIRRGYLEEIYSVLRFAATMLIIALLLMFAFHTTYIISRLLTGWTMVAYVVLDYIVRTLNKRRIVWNSKENLRRFGRALVLFAPGEKIGEAVSKLTAPGVFRDYFITGCVVTDDAAVSGDYAFPIDKLNEQTAAKLSHQWVDDVFILQGEHPVSRDLIETLIDMGITVHVRTKLMEDEMWDAAELRQMGRYTALTRSIKTVSAWKMFVKRAMDVTGGIIGCMITAVIFLFVAPTIYIASPGPVIFKQVRIGRGGKPFMMYKFRSMYPDAEDRKAEILAKNKADGLIFKMDEDPRIIGSEKKRRDGRPGGIGHFIRRTSIDEFPQFWNVLKGEMSLVGTRPPLPEEWDKYDVHHRARITVRTGITGLWQVSGRSDITDFEEIVRLDREYIENWSLKLDVKILLKTVVVVITGRGAQ